MINVDDLAQWIRTEHEKVEELSNKLYEHVAVIPRLGTEMWLSTLLCQFEHFRAHFEKHMALEEEGGYMAHVLEQRPVLHHRVEQLTGEHAEIRELMRSIMVSLPAIRPNSRLLLRDARSRIETLLAVINEHEEHENLLVHYVFSQDLGSKD